MISTMLASKTGVPFHSAEPRFTSQNPRCPQALHAIPFRKIPFRIAKARA
jgi:hypothetical protein